MKHTRNILCLLLVTMSKAGFGQYTKVNYKVINQYVNNMVFDTVGMRILATIPGLDVVNGNSIGYINPDSGALVNQYFVGSEPNPLALTDNNKYLFIGLDGAKTVKKFDISAGAVVQTFSLGGNTFNGPNSANNISCKPGTDSVIAVTRYAGGNSQGVAMYSNGNQLHDTISPYPTTIDIVHFYSPTVLFGYNMSNTGFDFSTLRASGSGVSMGSHVGNLFEGFGSDFYIHGDKAYADNGKALDLTGGVASLEGTFNIPTGKGLGPTRACYDKYAKLVCFAARGFGQDSVYLYRFNAGNLLLKDVIGIPGISGDVTKMICWAAGTKYAISTRDGKFIIINGLNTGIEIITPPLIYVYPNPVTGEVHVAYDKPLHLQLTDLSGKLLIETIGEAGMNMVDLAAGVYCLQVFDLKGNLLLTQKLMKQ